MENNINQCDCLALQISEVEMLRSMYPSSQEFAVSFPSTLDDMNRYISGESTHPPSELDFTLNLEITDVKDKLEVNASYPHAYPILKPEICARSSCLSRSHQKELNAEMMNYIQSLPSGDLCMLQVINWLMENGGQYFSANDQTNGKVNKKSNKTVDDLCRMWIYSHHIYNKFKKKKILDWGAELNLTGFLLPGKPGLICIEGYKKDCNEFMQNLKQLNWKKITLVNEEIEKTRKVVLNQFRKFDNMSEISFPVRKISAHHMDMGQFLKYLTEHNCAYAFQDLFGLEGQISSEK